MDLPPLDPATGFHKTLNRMGGMSPTLDLYSQAFVDFAPAAPGLLLDVGAAYGIATLAALAKGARVHAVDLEAQHLEILAARVPAAQRARLTTQAGRFPDDLRLKTGSLGAVLLARMLHFVDGPSISKGFAKLAKALAPGGKVFGLAVSPWLRKLVPFQKTYLARVKKGVRWPGEVEDVGKYDPEGAGGLPAKMHFLDPDVLALTAKEAGLSIERLELFSRPEYVGAMKLDGRELTGFVLVKAPGGARCRS